MTGRRGAATPSSADTILQGVGAHGIAGGDSGARLALLAACAGWLAFFAVYGFHGFNFREDGYLLTLAERMLRGDVPYRDVSYLRPPLSVAIQAALLRSVSGYAVAASRWYLALQVTGILVVTFALLRRVEPSAPTRALYALGAVVYAFTGGWTPMPWHTVDGIFCSALATWALVVAGERGSPGLAFVAGTMAGAAALAKQGFVVVVLGGLVLTLTRPGRAIGRRWWGGAFWYLGGVGLLAAFTAVYLLRHDALAAFVESVVLAPREITRAVFQKNALDLLVRMHLPYWIGAVVGLAFLALAALPMAGRSRLALAAGVGLWLLATLWVGDAGRRVQWHFLVQPVYTTIWIAGLGLLLVRAWGRVRLATGAVWAIALALCTLYASSWSFVGIRLALGHVLALPLTLLALVRRDPAEEAGADPSRPGRRFAAACVMVYAALFMALLQIAVPSLDASRLGGTVPFRTERLAGIRSSPLRVRGIDGVVELVRRETDAGDYVLAFMDFPGLYFLTGRRNPTRVDWFLPEELTRAEAERALADLRARPPRLVILAALHPTEMVGHAHLLPILGYILERYDQREAIGEFLVYRPRGAAPR